MHYNLKPDGSRQGYAIALYGLSIDFVHQTQPSL